MSNATAQFGNRQLAQRVLPRRGVTLVEMLVVVALTVLLMSIVAEVFVLASQTLTQLRAVSDANLKDRLVESTIRRDLENRTIRVVQPPVERVTIGPGPDGVMGTADDDFYFLPVGVDPAKGLGYFTIHEGMPSDEQGEDGDDWVAFTVRLKASSQIGLATTGSAYTDSAYTGRAVPGSEPDTGNGVARSQEAEVVYFLRQGTLYRRVLLVGVPQPSDIVNALGNQNNPSKLAPPHSWHEFYDISARPPLAFPNIPIVNSLGDLSYRSTRFGHRPPSWYTTGDPNGTPITVPRIGPGLEADHPGDLLFLTNGYSAGPLPASAIVTGGPTSVNGSSLEYNDSNRDMRHNATNATDELDHNHNYPFVNGSPLSLAEFWFGRPTMRETSAFNPAGGGTWDYPNDPASNVWGAFANSASAKYFDTLSAYATRPAEDALLTYVLSFDIKVWDPDAIPNPSRRPTSPAPVPALSSSDTTGAFVDLGRAATPTATDPSYLAVGPYPSSGTPAGPVSPSWDGTAGDPTAVFYPLGAFPRPGVWPPRRSVAAGTEFAPLTEPSYPATKAASGYYVPPGVVGHRRGFAMPYGTLLVDGTLNSTDLVIAPGTPGLPYGMLRAPASLATTYDTWCSAYTKPTQTWVDLNGNGLVDKGEPGIPVAPPYVIPIRGIQIKIRFADPDTRLTREITIVQELQQ